MSKIILTFNLIIIIFSFVLLNKVETRVEKVIKCLADKKADDYKAFFFLDIV